ncbi:flagellar export protein FliJ [Massilia violaceinigra]|uniref:Flagellar export protein FliJ n=1 Tax=Massilia violaceinigra TaxID=2045208 RepID=A0A2D2DI55_9BURK|nr:flagellar export protein FliJ [Massilia violaceinigra]ATQ74656.1 flagellar export protein FliJ [Massilia violaceinigra]
MTIKSTIDSLDTLVRLRSTKVEKLQADMAAQHATKARYQANLARLDSLASGSGASGALPLALALNCGQYKLAVIALADNHRTDLSLHEATMAVSQRALNDAWSERELLGQVLEQKKGVAALAQNRVDRKREDDLATQSWLAGRK